MRGAFCAPADISADFCALLLCFSDFAAILPIPNRLLELRHHRRTFLLRPPMWVERYNVTSSEKNQDRETAGLSRRLFLALAGVTGVAAYLAGCENTGERSASTLPDAIGPMAQRSLVPDSG